VRPRENFSNALICSLLPCEFLPLSRNDSPSSLLLAIFLRSPSGCRKRCTVLQNDAWEVTPKGDSTFPSPRVYRSTQDYGHCGCASEGELRVGGTWKTCGGSALGSHGKDKSVGERWNPINNAIELLIAANVSPEACRHPAG